ncbi:TRAP transporter large permease [Ornithinimicrobium sp. W1679]|uniref:TRAP transporter large permease n=1 Tax=Ornithinimicrobium sp. W1679 TaxID=3418770 RepID=UPI003CF367F7
MTAALLIGGFVVLILLRVPVALALLAPSLVYLLVDPQTSVDVAFQRLTAGVNSFTLLAVPLFIMTGIAANAAGITARLFDFAERLLGHVQGSLGYVNVLTSLVFSWMSGAAIADAASIGKVVVPEMKRRGWKESFTVGITASSSLIGPIMPPSIPAIIYAVTAGVSIGALFVASIIPAFLLALVLALMVWLHARKHPGLQQPKASGRQMWEAARAAVLPLLTPVIILGGILGGIVTPTEAAGLAVVWILILAVFYGRLTPRSLWRIAAATAETTGSVLLIVASASLFGWVLTRERVPQDVAELIMGLTTNPVVFLILVNVVLLLVGTMLEPVSAVLIMVPVLLPVVETFGIDPLHFGVFMILNLVIGLITPPVGLVLYVLSSATDVPFPKVVSGTLPFLVPVLFVLLIVTFIPALSMWLPGALGMI